MDEQTQPARDEGGSQEMMGESDPQYTTMVREIPASREDQFEQYYNRKSNLIVLSGPRGPLLARYTGQEPPESDRHRFLVTFPNNYRVFEKAAPPDVANADVEAVCWPVERNRDPRFSLATGSASQRTRGPSPKDTLITSDYDNPITEQHGVRVTEDGTHIRGRGGGVSADDGGVRIQGSFKQPSPERRGMTQQSPLYGIIPKTVITFFVSDYLPDVVSIQKLIQFVNMLRAARSWLSLLRDDFGEELRGSAYGPNSAYVDDPRDRPNNDSDF